MALAGSGAGAPNPAIEAEPSAGGEEAPQPAVAGQRNVEPWRGSIRLAQFAVPQSPGQGAAVQAGQGVARPADGGIEFGTLLREIPMQPGPLRWNGNLALEYRRQSASGGASSSGWVQSGNLRAATYLGEAWLAQLRGALGYVVTSNQGGDQGSNSATRALTGEAGISLAPMSRFPFEASYVLSDSRATGEIASTDFRNERMTLRQAYRTEGGTQYNARYDRSTLTSGSFGTDVLQVMEGSVSTRIGFHNLEGNVSHSANTGGSASARSDITRLVGNHGWSPRSNIAVNSLASVNDARMRALGVAGQQVDTTLTRVTQFTSFATWRPEEGEPLYDEDHPMYFTGSVRYFGSMAEAGPSRSDSQSLALSGGMSYSISPITRLTANAGVTHSATGTGQGALFTTQNVAAVHAPMPLRLSESLTYSWSVNAAANNATGGEGGARQGASVSGTHTLMQDTSLGEFGRLAITGSQSVGANMANGANGFSLSHHAGATWTAASGGSSQTYVSFTASDTRTAGTVSSDFQIVNLQATRQAPLSAVSSWSGNLTMQFSRTHSSAVPGIDGTGASGGFSQSTVTSGGNLTYTHNRFAGVPRLRFVAFLNVNQSQFASRERGDLNAPRDNLSSVFEGRLEYSVGKLDTRLTLRSSTAAGRRTSLIFLRATRQF